MYALKPYGLPEMYWNGMLRGPSHRVAAGSARRRMRL